MIFGVTTPRNELPLEQLPRGFVPFPERAVQAVDYLQQKTGRTYTVEQRQQSLELHTLSYFYEGYPVAYRSVDGGIEVLAVGFEEAAKFERCPQDGVKMVQT
jgi:hypothetical protein